MHRFHKRAVGVTDPHRCRQLAGETHKPGITIVFRRSRFARSRLTDAGARAGAAFNYLIEDVIDLAFSWSPLNTLAIFLNNEFLVYLTVKFLYFPFSIFIKSIESAMTNSLKNPCFHF